ncbi:F18 [Felid gammaherpesvirus 1]|uniref:F18 n=1 Tax=Felid gammaherpesvirus 1 TaxID=2560468 RepID=A0A0M4MPV3_9GAMA|nr:F18 [Felis catus gammaherpesvirus 1]ALE14740.1 F18 [Felis catus gammaherpesvirus 1]
MAYILPLRPSVYRLVCIVGVDKPTPEENVVLSNITSKPVKIERGLMFFAQGQQQHVKFYDRLLQTLWAAQGKHLPFHTSAILEASEQHDITFIYGDPIEGNETSLSRDLRNLFQHLTAFNPTQGASNQEYSIIKVLRFSVLGISCDTCSTQEGNRLLLGSLCDAINKKQQYFHGDIKHATPVLKIDKNIAPQKFYGDLLSSYVCGMMQVPGIAHKYTYLSHNATVERASCVQFSKLGFFTTKDVYDMFWEDNETYQPLRHFKTVCYSTSYLYTPATESLQLLVNRYNQFFGESEKQIHFGIILTSNNNGIDVYKNLLKLICTGQALTQGFFRYLPNNTILEPVKFYGNICTAIDRPRTTSTERHLTDVFCLGVDTPEEESGREYSLIVFVLRAFLQFIYPDKIFGISAVTAPETIHAKLTAVGRGMRGIKIPLSNLPWRVKRQLKPFTHQNIAHNKSIIKGCWLNSISPVCLISVDPDHSDRLRMLCALYKCNCILLGRERMYSSIKIFDDTTQDGQSITFNRYTPRFPLPAAKSPEYQQIPNNSWMYTLPPLNQVLTSILQHPTVACKDFIVKHIDRLSSGRIGRQQGVGLKDIPIADYSVLATQLTTPIIEPDRSDWSTATTLDDLTLRTKENPPCGLVSAIGEATALMLKFPFHGARVAITEAVLNLISGPVDNSEDIICSLAITWPLTTKSQEELKSFLTACNYFCAHLNVSLTISSCSTSNQVPHKKHVNASNFKGLVVTATCPCKDVSKGLTPDLKKEDSSLLWIPTADGNLTEGTVIQSLFFNDMCGETISIEPKYLRRVLQAFMDLKQNGLVISAHDVGSGGVFTTLFEMAYSGNLGISCVIPDHLHPISTLCSETPGIVIEVPVSQALAITSIMGIHHVNYIPIGTTSKRTQQQPFFSIWHKEEQIFSESLQSLAVHWNMFSVKQENKAITQGDPIFSESQYGVYEMTLTAEPIYAVNGVDKFHSVRVYVLPGNHTPYGLLNALHEAGFLTSVMDLSDPRILNYQPRTADDDPAIRPWGICIVGSVCIEDPSLGEEVMGAIARGGKHYNEMKVLLSDPKVFCLALGHTACNMLFSMKVMGYNKPSNCSVKCKQNLSKKFESRWLNFKIPKNTTAVALQSLRGSLLPCWAQGTHIGFEHPNPKYMERLTELGMTGSLFHGPTFNSGAATTYPMNPAEASIVSSICSKDGRHLAMLHDPSLSNNLWQWPSVPKRNPSVQASPWKRMFMDLHMWANTIRDVEVVLPQEDPLRTENL